MKARTEKKNISRICTVMDWCQKQVETVRASCFRILNTLCADVPF